MHEECFPHRIPHAWNSEGEPRGRSTHQNHSKRAEENMEERNVENITGKSPEQGLTSAKDLATELTEGGESHYNIFD